MRRRSKKRQAVIDAIPAVASIPEHRTATVGAVDEGLREFCRRLPCVVDLGKRGPDGAHSHAGGDPCHRAAKRVHGDWVEHEGRVIGNIFPACRRHHGEQHSHGVESFGRALIEVCEAVGQAYLAGWSPEGLGAAAKSAGGYDKIARAELERGDVGELPF
jgi:hypothetical protein